MSLPTVFPVLAVIGLTEPKDGDWNRLRGMQYASLAHSIVPRIMAQSIAGSLTALVYMGHISNTILTSWLLMLAATLVYGLLTDRQLIDADKRRLSRAEVRTQRSATVINALAWIIPMVVFGYLSDPQTQTKVWVLLALMMTASAILLPEAPMNTIVFSGIVGLSGIAYFFIVQVWDMAIVAVAMVATIIAGAIDNGRRYLATKVAEAGMQDRDKVVSLLLREFEEGEADWLWEIDISRRLRGVSPRLAFALGKTMQSAEGKPLIELLAGPNWESGKFPSSLHDLTERLKRRESFSNITVHVMIDGKPRWWEFSGAPQFDERGTFDGFRGVGSDVTEAREQSDRIAYLARYDTLTELPNRVMLTEALATALQYAEEWRSRCAFLMIDLDRFKSVNDTLGHYVGDQLLARVSQRIKEQLSENEMCARLGGDEFAIVIRDASKLEHVAKVAQRIIDRVTQPYDIDSHTLFVGCSIGSAIGPRDGDTVETLMRNADLALYRAKDAGGNTHHTFEPILHQHAEERRRLEFSLRKALERNEFVIHYQPVVDAVSEGVVSFEALLRWDSKEHGFVSPGKFIPIAEDTRLIIPIGQWVLREACREATRWPDHVRVAVNVSGEQLLDPNFVASVVSALSLSGLPARRLEIEVTESIFLRDPNQARAALEECMALGCAIALDDFGTGYSSLGYLRKMRFSTIKVDRSFVQGAATGNAESLAIIRAVVAMADSLEMSTTSEGVETQSELEIVRQLGCRKIQGFYFGRPMPAQDAAKLFYRRSSNPIFRDSNAA